MINIKLKPLLPTLRERKRYMVYEVISEKPIKDFSLIKNKLYNDAKVFLGEYGMSQTSLKILPEKYNMNTQRGIMRMSHTAVNQIKSALLFVQHIEKEPVIVRSIAVSGTIKKASLCLRGG